jgi:single-strand DNA-binding protein
MPRSDPFNHAVLRGRISSAPDSRQLPSGSVVVQFDVSACDPDGHRVSVPVSWADPPAARRDELAPDLEVVVVGWVRRRFFRANGSTQSRTEVVATDVVPARRRRTVAGAIGRVVDALVDP